MEDLQLALINGAVIAQNECDEINLNVTTERNLRYMLLAVYVRGGYGWMGDGCVLVRIHLCIHVCLLGVTSPPIFPIIHISIFMYLLFCT